MKDLNDFKNQQIKALQSEVCSMKEYISQLETFIFELTDNDCPSKYKNIVRKEVFGNKGEE